MPMQTASKIYSAMVLLLLALAGSGCAGTLTGQILDAQTGQPVPGAVVLGVWTKVAGLPGLAHTELVAVNETETDAQGQFALDRPGSFGIDEESITVYKFGYVAWNNLFIFPTSERRPSVRVPDRIPLEHFPPTQSHRRHMTFINSATAAGMYGLNRIPRFWNALRRELEMP